MFESDVKSVGANLHPLNVFMSKDAVAIWAKHLDFEGVAIEDGDKRFIPLTKTLRFDTGVVMEDLGFFGQSLAVLQKRPAAER